MPDLEVHKRAPPAPKQKTFPARRHNTRSKAAASSSRNVPPKLLKRQSTLTQLDFVSSPYSTREVIPNSSEEDEEYFKPQPKRRKKTNGRARDQSTLTQKWGDVLGSDGGELADWEEEDTIVIEDEVGKGKAQDTQFTGKYLYGRVQEVEEEASPPVRQHRMMVPSSSDVGEVSTRPTTADSKANPKTPRRERTEVPSSQTPSSAKLSVQGSGRSRGEDVSPLKGRSCTPVPMKKMVQSLSSDSPSKMILKHMDSDLLKMENLGSSGIKAVPWKAEVVASPRRKKVLSPQQRIVSSLPKRKLVRATTIQDSQDEFGLDDSPEVESESEMEPEPARMVATDSSRAIGGTQDPIVDTTSQDHAPRSNLKRTATVLDSQSESDLDDHTSDNDEVTVLHVEPDKAPAPRKPAQKSQVRFSDHCETVPNYHGHDEEMHHEQEEAHDQEMPDEQEEEQDDQLEDHSQYNYTQTPHQQTFDPVSAALDLDASRFGREPTQAQGQLPALAGYESEEEMEDYDTAEENPVERVEDSEPEFVAESPIADPETQFIADSPPRFQTTNKSAGEEEDVTAYMHSLPPIIPDMPAEEASLLDLPQLPRPSQVSTVVSSSSRPNSGHGEQQQSLAWANCLSSSPFPLPPESWRAEQKGRWETQSSEIYDFSLPPPPPLLSSSSARGGGGG